MELLANYRDLLSYIESETNELEIPANDRNTSAAALYDIAHEHAKGICILLENHCSPPSFALVRVLFEAFIRAAWLLHCATDNEVSTFLAKDKIELDSKEEFYFGDMINKVEAKLNWPDTLSQIKNQRWQALNSYTHGGQFQITRRYDGCTIGPHHNLEEESEVIQFSSLIAYLIFGELLILSDSHAEKAEQLSKELYEKISPWCFSKT